jgi:hypothetical protein
MADLSCDWARSVHIMRIAAFLTRSVRATIVVITLRVMRALALPDTLTVHQPGSPPPHAEREGDDHGPYFAVLCRACLVLVSKSRIVI